MFYHHQIVFLHNSPGNDQNLQDITLYANHSDQQLKAQTALIIGSFIKAALLEGRGDFHSWIVEHLPKGQSKGLLETVESELRVWWVFIFFFFVYVPETMILVHSLFLAS